MSQHRGQALARSHTLGADLDALSIADKAALRLLVRADAATASQLARLIYRRERTAQDRLLELWRAGVLERSTDPRSGRGTATYAYRTSPSPAHISASASLAPAACTSATPSTSSKPSAPSPCPMMPTTLARFRHGSPSA